jgi:predicted metalloprotease with PDZ domain
MGGVDLSRFAFDFDLTFAVLLMNGDGTVYHRYGTRVATDPESRLSTASLVRVLKGTLEDHRAYQKKPSPPAPKPKETVEDLFARLPGRKAPDCFHCHMVDGARRDLARKAGTWDAGEIYKYPPPEQVGLTMNVDDQELVEAVKAGSAAAAAGLKKGDRLVRIAGVRVRSLADIQWELEKVPAAGGKVELGIERGGAARTVSLSPAKGWKVADPLDFSWRSTMWAYGPEPGFGGPELKPEELKAAGLAEDAFAFKVTYLVDWGEKAQSGRNAQKAGIRRGDVVISIAGKRDFKSVQHFHSWYRFTQKPGSAVPVELVRDRKKQTVTLTVVD